MENNYDVKFTQKAEEDLEEIYNYILAKLFDGTTAESLMDKMENSIMRLKEFTFSCSYIVDKPLKDRGYRKLIVDNYIVFYLINETEKQVVIMCILYGASNYQNIL